MKEEAFKLSNHGSFNSYNNHSYASTENNYFGDSNQAMSTEPNQHLDPNNSWRIGLVCKKDCYYIMLDILKCLEANGYEWKLVSSSYKLKCRKKNDENQGSKSLNILIQVFSVS